MNLHLTYTKPQIQIFFEQDEYRFIIVPKGRRFGATQGAMHAALEWSLSGEAVLWGDTIHSNIDRYFERYAKAAMNKAKIPYSYNSQQKKLTYPQSKGFIDFRSADRPENWEGFGYHKIILNEAGIILKNDYLYTNAVLPMLIDFPNTKMFALGVPKGKKQKNGKEHKFYTLWLNAINEKKGYKAMQFSSYDNPLLAEGDIKELEDEIRDMNPVMVDQEIYGKFVDEVFDALWSPDMIIHKDQRPEQYGRVVVAVDPSASKKGDQVGIVAVGRTGDKYYTITDNSGNYSPSQWGAITANTVRSTKADAIVIETNQGGDMAENVIRQFDKTTRIIRVHAVKAKEVRAEPVVSLYEQGKVFHLGIMPDLENEMLTWIPGSGRSPNRVDALVYAITELAGRGEQPDLNKIEGIFF